MELIIRQEKEQDHQQVFDLVKQAFAEMPFSDQTEHTLVEKLRNSDAFIPELSIVAEYSGRIVGHILFTKIKILEGEKEWTTLTLAPVSVLPEYQRKGIGTQLIEYAHEKARQLGYQSAILIGHASYYPTFGYQPIHTFNIKMPFEIKPENAMAVELIPNSLNNINGIVKYSEPFGI